MNYCEGSTAQLQLALDQMTEHYVVSSPDGIRELHNNYVRTILASTAAKEVSLTVGLIEAVWLADEPNVAGLQIIATARRSGTRIAVARSNSAARPRLSCRTWYRPLSGPGPECHLATGRRR
jgi:hypothetical protein